jgi:molybdopterin-guanine dinucleotide biosynthesis protein A
MGTSKALLEWHGSTLLRHTLDIVTRCADGPVIVVRSPGQELPPLPDPTWIVDDTHPGAGPLAALVTGLDAFGARADRALVCGVDTPFLTPAFIAVLIAALTDDVDIALPAAEGRRHPLPAVVRVTVLPTARTLVGDGQRALFALVDRCRSRDVAEGALRAADPSLASLRNLNDRQAYEAARAEPTPLHPG